MPFARTLALLVLSTLALGLSACVSSSNAERQRAAFQHADPPSVVRIAQVRNLTGRPLQSLDNDLWRRGGESDLVLNAGVQNFLLTYTAALEAILLECGHRVVLAEDAAQSEVVADYELHAALGEWDASALVSEGVIRAEATLALVDLASGELIAESTSRTRIEVWRLTQAQQKLIEEGYGASPSHRQRDLREVYRSLAYALAQSNLHAAELLPRWRGR